MQDGKVVVWDSFINSQEEKRSEDKGEREGFTQLKQSSRE